MIYVIAQFLLLAVLIWPIESLLVSELSPIGMMLIFIGSLVALFAMHVNRPGNFNIRPIPKSSGELITSGVYHYIRHPMYCSLFFIGLGLLFCQFSWWKLLAWALLVITLALKARFEERALVLIYSDYKAYQKITKAFIPWLW